MSLETVSYISDLNAENPAVNDPKSQGDDHIRNIKIALVNSILGFTGPVVVGGTDTGVTNAYVLTAALPAYVANTIVIWKPVNANTSSATININGLGTRAIKQIDGAALTANDLIANRYVAMVDNGTEYRLLSVTKNYVDQLAFTSVLPAQTDNGGKMLITDGTTASWGASLQALALSDPLPESSGGTGQITLAAARTAMGAAASGANSDITSLSGLTTPLSLAQGGIGGNTPGQARDTISAANRGGNTDITALYALTTPITIAQGGTGATTAATARSSLGVAKSGVNTDLTSIPKPAIIAGLAYEPVQNGTGVGQGNGYFTKIGYDPGNGRPKITIDVTDFGFLITSISQETAKARAYFVDAGTISSDFNIATVVKNATGKWTVTFTSAMANATYTVNATAINGASDGVFFSVESQSTGSFVLRCWESRSVAYSPTAISFVVHGDI